MAAGALATFAGSAGAAPKPTVSQVQKSVNRLTSQEDQAAQQYDQSEQQLSQAKQRLDLVNREVKTDQAKFSSMRSQIAAIAATAYENGNMTSMGALLTSNNPQYVLSQASVLLQLSSDRSAQITEFIQTARQLQDAQFTALRTKQAMATLDAQRLARKKSLGKSLSQKKALLATLTAAEQQTVTTTSIGGGGTTKASNPVPTSSRPARPWPTPTPSWATRTCTGRPGRARSTARDSSRRRGPPPGSRSRGPPTSRWPRCPRSPPATCSPAISCSLTVTATSGSTSAATS